MEGKRFKIPGTVEFTFDIRNPTSAKAIEEHLRNSKGFLESKDSTLTYSQCLFFSNRGKINITLFDVAFDTEDLALKSSTISEADKIFMAKEVARKFLLIEVIRKLDN